MKRLTLILSIISTTGAFSASAQRLPIATHTSSGEHGEFQMIYTYDDSGMSGDSGSANATNDVHDFDDPTFVKMGLLKNNANSSTNSTPPPHWVEYDLGESHELTNVVIWSYNFPAWYIQGMQEITVEVREFGGDSTVAFSGEMPAAPGAGAAPTPPSLDVDLTGLTGRFVRITTGDWPDQSWWDDLRPELDPNTDAALSEVRIYGDPTGLGNAVTEACCFNNRSCANMAAMDCINAMGTPQGTNTECFLTICPQPPEACCFRDGTCMVAESRGFIGDTGSGWDTTSAVSIEASDERAIPSGGAWAGEAVFAINGNGVVGGGSSGDPTDEGKHISNNWNFTGNESDDTHWMAVTPAKYGTNLHAAAPTGTILTLLFTFDQVYELDELHIYSAMASGPPWMDTGIKEVEILVGTVNSGDRNDWTSVAWNTGDGIVEMNPGTVDPYSVDEFVELDGADAQYVLLSVLSNHGATWGTGAGEFRFYGVSKPPAKSDKGAVLLIH